MEAMKSIPCITVIVTTYNSEKTIGRLLDSVLKQQGVISEFRLEILVFDDASTDGTVAKVAEFGITAEVGIRNSGGPNWGRNLGLRRATGDWISIADHDDEWVPHRIQTLLRYAEGASILSSGFILRNAELGRDAVRTADCANGYRDFAPNETFMHRLVRRKGGQNMYIGGLLLRADRASVLFEEEFGQLDYDWLLRLTEGCSTREVCQPLFIRHVVGSNLSLNPTYRARDFAFALKTLDKYRTTYPELVRQAEARWHGSYGRYWYAVGDFKQARTYFKQSDWSPAIFAYYLTTFVGGNWIRRRFQVFG